MPRAKPRSGFPAIPVHDVAAFTFSERQRADLLAALSPFPPAAVEGLIYELERFAGDFRFFPWTEDARVPGLKTRQVGLRDVATLANELAAKLSPDIGGTIGADWASLHCLMLETCRPRNVEQPLSTLQYLLIQAAAAAETIADRPKQDAQPQKGRLFDAAHHVASLMHVFLGHVPTYTDPDPDVGGTPSVYVAVLRICVRAWRKTDAGRGELIDPAQAAVIALRDRATLPQGSKAQQD